MGFVVVLTVTAALVFLLKKPLMRHPMVFYVLAVLLDVLFVASVYLPLPQVLHRFLFLPMQKCTLALAIFAIVMFIGVFRKDSMVGLALRPVRAELSIIACILALGHMAMYLVSFSPRLFAGNALGMSFLLFFATDVLLLVLLLILGVTSFDMVKHRMSAIAWKRLQKWAYVFFGLIYLHLVSILLPSALLQGVTARMSIIVYSVLFLLYVVLRLRRAIIDRSASLVT